MLRSVRLVAPCLLAIATIAGAQTNPGPELRVKSVAPESYSISRPGYDTPLLVFNAPLNGRPFIHPINAPDGRGELTEFSPAHHPHQTGIYVAFPKVNDRDFFHNRGADYYARTNFSFMTFPGEARIHVTYRGLDADGLPLFTEDQWWAFRDLGYGYILDLEYRIEAQKPLTFAKHDYGGLFVRMPWKPTTGGEAMNSEGRRGADAEGQKARWMSVATPIPGRPDYGRITVMDSPSNPNHPATWRLDSQLGFGPAPSRPAEWTLDLGQTATYRYRLLVTLGPLNRPLIEGNWSQLLPR